MKAKIMEKKLAEAGNYVEVHRIKDALHGFFALGIRFFHCAGSFSYYERILKKGSVKIERRIFELEKTG